MKTAQKASHATEQLRKINPGHVTVVRGVVVYRVTDGSGFLLGGICGEKHTESQAAEAIAAQS